MEDSQSVYRRYKRLTSHIVEWLVVTGRAANCPPSLTQPTQSNTGSEKYQLRIANFVPLARWIKEHRSTIHAPSTILADLDRVIELRARFTQRVRGPGPATDNDNRHGYFVGVLQELKAVLERLPVAQATRNTAPETVLSTRFSALDIADIPDEDKPDIPERQQFLASVDQTIDYTYAADEIPPIEEAALHFRLLLQDFRHLGDLVLEQWDKYTGGSRDLAAAAATTNMALLIAKDFEESARKFIIPIMAADSARRQSTIQDLSRILKLTEQAATSLLDGNIYLLLYNFLLGAPQGVDSLEDYLAEEEAFYNAFTAMTSWFTKVCLLQNASGNRLRAQEGQSGDYSYSSTWEEQSVADKRRKTRAFVTETATELHFVGSLEDRAGVQDALSRDVFEIVEEKTLYISTVFGINLLRNIYSKLLDTGQSHKPLNNLHSFLDSTAKNLTSLAVALPAGASHDSVQQVHRHMTQSRTDFFQALKTANQKAGIATDMPHFTLRRHPVLCGLLLHAERVLAQDTALAVEKALGGLTAAVHLGHAFTIEGLIRDLGNLGPTVRAQGDSAFFLGGKRPTTAAEYLPSYALAIGRSVVSAAPTSSRRSAGAGAGASLAARKSKLELSPPAPFSRLVQARLQDPHGRFSLTGEDLVGLLVGSGNAMMKKIYGGSSSASSSSLPGADRKPPAPASPLQHAALLLHAEVPTLEHDYVSSARVAWQALRAVQAVLGGPREGLELGGGSRGRGGRGGRGGRRAASAAREQEERSVDSAEVLVGRVFAGVANEGLMRAAGKAYADAVAVGDS